MKRLPRPRTLERKDEGNSQLLFCFLFFWFLLCFFHNQPATASHLSFSKRAALGAMSSGPAATVSDIDELREALSGSSLVEAVDDLEAWFGTDERGVENVARLIVDACANGGLGERKDVPAAVAVVSAILAERWDLEVCRRTLSLALSGAILGSPASSDFTACFGRNALLAAVAGSRNLSWEGDSQGDGTGTTGGGSEVTRIVADLLGATDCGGDGGGGGGAELGRSALEDQALVGCVQAIGDGLANAADTATDLAAMAEGVRGFGGEGRLAAVGGMRGCLCRVTRLNKRVCRSSCTGSDRVQGAFRLAAALLASRPADTLGVTEASGPMDGVVAFVLLSQLAAEVSEYRCCCLVMCWP